MVKMALSACQIIIWKITATYSSVLYKGLRANTPIYVFVELGLIQNVFVLFTNDRPCGKRNRKLGEVMVVVLARPWHVTRPHGGTLKGKTWKCKTWNCRTWKCRTYEYVRNENAGHKISGWRNGRQLQSAVWLLKIKAITVSFLRWELSRT